MEMSVVFITIFSTWLPLVENKEKIGVGIYYIEKVQLHSVTFWTTGDQLCEAYTVFN